MTLRGRRNLGYGLVLLALVALGAWLGQRMPVAPEPASAPASGPLPGELRGIPRVLDGDTWELAGHRLRIDGLDAPEFGQTCGPEHAPWPCGREVHCRLHGLDRYQRPLATCAVAGEDLQRWMVRSGWAVAYGSAGDGADYTLEEIAAQHARAGIWRDGFTRPRQWRREQRD